VIVDDDPADAYVLQRVLFNIALPLEVAVLADGAAFIEFYSENQHQEGSHRRQLVLLDINMPIMNGFEALIALNKSGVPRHTPILMFSTSCEECDVTKAYELGVNGYVKKPSAIAEAETMMSALDAYWLRTNVAMGFRVSAGRAHYIS
jgi:CheY-like chemotaxis protein